MPASRKPTINLKCPAAAYAAPAERIAEFSTASGVGGLMQIRETIDGRCAVQIYRTDPGVFVSHDAQQSSIEKAAPDMLAALKFIAAPQPYGATQEWRDNVKKGREMVLAAIAKAEGRA